MQGIILLHYCTLHSIFYLILKQPCKHIIFYSHFVNEKTGMEIVLKTTDFYFKCKSSILVFFSNAFNTLLLQNKKLKF